jgi:hypothetical protein
MEFLTLRNGPTVPSPVVHLAIDLELRGFTLRTHPDGRLLVTPNPGLEPKPTLTDEERQKIVAWKAHLLALVAYEPPPPIWQTPLRERYDYAQK